MWLLIHTYLLLRCFTISSAENQVTGDEDDMANTVVSVEEIPTEFDEEDSMLKFHSRFVTKAEDALAKLLPDVEPEHGREGLVVYESLERELSSDSDARGPPEDDTLFRDYGVYTERLEQPLLVGKDKELHYKVLVNTPHGRHLLLVSLLEQLHADCWSSRCGGKLRMFLPDSLRNQNQPTPPRGACMLDNVVENGMVMDRDMIKEEFDKIVPKDINFEIFSWFSDSHRNVIHNLAGWIIDAESFGSSFSMLVLSKEWLSKQMFVELVNLVIVGREDTGFAMPSMETYMPEDFFEKDIIAPIYGGSHGPDLDDFVMNQPAEVIQIDTVGIGSHGPDVDIEVFLGSGGPVHAERGSEFYESFNGEGNLVNAERGPRQWTWTGMRWEWRRTRRPTPRPTRRTARPTRRSTTRPTTRPTLRSTPRPTRRTRQPTIRTERPTRRTQRPTRRTQRPTRRTQRPSTTRHAEDAESYFREDPVANAHHSEWHRIGSGTRWGEYFYFMHGQMLARYEAERLSLGLSPTRYFTVDQWDRMVLDTYNPRLGDTWGIRWPGTIDTSQMHRMRRRVEMLATNSARYFRGEDRGIDRFGGVFERGLHNTGHVQISQLTGRGRGVMASSVGAMRDPIFYRWHGYVNTVFLQYKNSLGPYTDTDLGFDGVRVVSSHVQPQWGDTDTFYTYRERTSVRLDSLDAITPGTRMNVEYMRMNHRPFRWNFVIESDLRVSTPAIVRVFMMPSMEGGNRAVIHMDHFYVELSPGINRVSREELDAPHLSKSRWSLDRLQDSLMTGQMSQADFSWGGCGWPRHLNIPRGTEQGMPWTLVVMVSRVLTQDRGRLRNWASNNHLAWGYCGVRSGTGTVPDTRPMGFPVDRDFTDIDMLAGGRENWNIKEVIIRHGVE